VNSTEEEKCLGRILLKPYSGQARSKTDRAKRQWGGKGACSRRESTRICRPNAGGIGRTRRKVALGDSGLGRSCAIVNSPATERFRKKNAKAQAHD